MKTKYLSTKTTVAKRSSRQFKTTSGRTTTHTVVPPIPYHRVKEERLSKDQYASFKLRSDPTSTNSPTYKLAICYYSVGTPEEWLLYMKAVEQVLVGQNVTNGPHKYAMHRQLLKGDAIARFNKAATEVGTKTNNNLTQVLK